MKKNNFIVVLIIIVIFSLGQFSCKEKIDVIDEEEYVVTYSLGSIDFIEKYKNKMTYFNDPIDNKKYKKGEYVKLYHPSQIVIDGIGYSHDWNTKPDGSGINYDINSNGFFMPDYNVKLYAIWTERLFLLDKEFDPKEYGFYPYVPKELIGTWADDVWAYLHPEAPTLTYQISVIVFDETTATKWEQRLDGSKLTNPQTHYIRVEYNSYDSLYSIYCVNKNSSHPLNGNLTYGYYGHYGVTIDSGIIFIGANKYDVRVYDRVE
jgi:hypothetical protein